MMTKQITVPLVGMFARPPASTVLASLPGGAKLILEAEPENKYDTKAIKVLVAPEQLPESQYARLEEALPGQGRTLAETLEGGDIWLGYIADSDGKICRQAGSKGNREVGELMLDSSHQARLGFSPDGKPVVIVTVET
jgi:hypothetical protein